MKTALIITGGEFHELTPTISYDYVIACDKGAAYAKRLGIIPDVILGDFDSYEGAIPDANSVTEVLTYPIEKDDTDTMLAIKLALSKGFNHVIIICALGKRMDHLYANIQSLTYIATHDGIGEIISDSEHLRTFTEREGELKIGPKNGYSLSLFSLSDKCEGVTIKGAKYNTDSITFTNDFPLGHGNSVVTKEAVISIKSGVLLIIESKTE